jgi:predicted nuclease of restriction endonuclease-like RecB superfamily
LRINKVRNKFEKEVDAQLRRSKVPYKYEAEKIPYILNGIYIPDFILRTSLGKVYIECKGYFRPEDKKKLKAVKRQHPEIDLRLLFYSYKPQYIKWCIKHGFKYAVQTIPKEWYLGL